MALPLYILSLALSSGVCAAMARKTLQGLGFVPSLESGLLLTAGLAGLFAAAQLAYVAFTRLAAPSRGGAPLVFETLSNAAALTFLPYLAGVSFIPFLKAHLHGTGLQLLDKAIEKLSAGLVEPVALAGVFLAAHCFLKLLSFFSATQSRPSGRLPAFAWAGTAALCALAGLISLDRWRDTLEAARDIPLADAKPVAVDGAYAMARSLPLGADYTIPLDGHAGENFTLGWALTRDYDAPPLELYVTLRIDNAEPVQRVVSLNGDGWAELRPFAVPIAEDAKTCTVSWDFARDAPTLVKFGMRRPPSASDAAWVAGPHFAAPVDAKKAPNFVIIAMDGVSSAHLQSQGYSRSVMPVLENLAKSATFFPACVPPAPEPAAAYMTLFTGLSPLEHGFLGARTGPLPAEAKTLPEVLHEQHYATAAFTEADWRVKPDLGYGSGFERGFDSFDGTTPLSSGAKGALPGAPAPPQHAGSAATLEKAGAWVEAHAQDRFLLFVRLREAGAPAPLARYGDGFIADHAKPDPYDVYDTAMAAVDQALPAFMDRLTARGLKDKTVVVFVSPFGIAPERSAAHGPTLTDDTVMTPLLIMAPGRAGSARNAIVGMQDIAPTLLRMLDPAVTAIPGKDLREYAAGNEEISMFGNPLVMSLRNRRWRFTWSTGLDPFTREKTAGEAPISLINVEQSRLSRSAVDDLARFPDEAQRGRATLQKYLDEHTLPKGP